MKKNNREKKKIIKLNNEFTSQNFIHAKSLKTILIVTIMIFVLLLGRLAFIQFVDGAYLKEKAYSQQTINQIISPKRGNIYDSTGKVLAKSVPVDTITINPLKFEGDNDAETLALKEKIAKGLSDIFELDYDETLEKVNSSSQVETIIRKVDQDKVEKLKTWMKENEIKVGINIDEDTKRYYPYDTVLSNVLGFCGTENNGLVGIESTYNSTLQGTPGKIVSSKGSDQSEIPNAEETYISPENGSDITLTIDYNIQSIVEQYLAQACDSIKPKNGGTCIIMNPKNGKILAMATYPNYNLNTPSTPNQSLAETYDKLSSEEQNNALHTMWKNRCVSDLYEPGSVFKLITASVALEEGITTPDVDNDFYCKGFEQVADYRITCWTSPHHYLSLRGALENSCNPALMQLGKRIGTSTLYRYYRAYGLFETTGSNLYGESNSLFTEESSVGDVELATMSFGQRLNITPLQMITAVSAIANDGILMKPTIVDKITNTDTGAVTEVEPVAVRQVLSKETANTMKDLMQSVVENGSGYRAAVSGYTVGGKTGTSEPPIGKESEGYVASFCGISPVEDTQVVALVCLYGVAKGQQGGVVAAPVVSQMLTKILPSLNVPADVTELDNSTKLTTLPDVRNKTFAEAEKVLKADGFTVKSVTTQDINTVTVSDQVPKPGVSLAKNSVVILYDNSNTTRTSVTVPNLTYKSASQAINTLHSLNLNASIDGSGVVVSQDPPFDSKVEEGTIINISLKKNSSVTH